MSTALLGLSHPPPVGWPTRFVSTLTTLYTFGVTENPLLWKRRQGKNHSADGRGPYYVHGAPSREIEKGKGILASLEFLKKHGAYLFTGQIIDPEGKSVANATLDFWHACPDGVYYFDRYELRGTVTTDSEGYFEVLSVTPGAYLGRAGHFHFIITPTAYDLQKYEPLTTQAYVCTGNNKDEMNTDFVNTFYWRNPPYQLMNTSWCLPESNGGKNFHDFPALAEVVEDEDALNRVTKQIKEWNDRLAELDDYKGEKSLKVVAGGNKVIQLSPKGGLGLW